MSLLSPSFPLGATAVSPLCLGGNVFGWTADRAGSFAVLDAYAEAGGNFIDTADVYSAWVPGNTGGDSERIIGEWLRTRGNRAEMVIATKGAKHPDKPGLGEANIRRSAEDSLTNLGTDYIDLYYAHADDDTVELEETLSAFDELVREGKVRYLGASNFSGARLEESLTVSAANGLASYAAIQDAYNLMERERHETELLPVVLEHGLASFPYFGLASGFLTGKYRPGVEVASARARGATLHIGDRGDRVLAALDIVAGAHGVPVAAVALAWLLTRPGVTAPIASARTVEQFTEVVQLARVDLTPDEVSLLDSASI